jgi:hypothetical protein
VKAKQRCSVQAGEYNNAIIGSSEIHTDARTPCLYILEYAWLNSIQLIITTTLPANGIHFKTVLSNHFRSRAIV